MWDVREEPFYSEEVLGISKKMTLTRRAIGFMVREVRDGDSHLLRGCGSTSFFWN